MKKIVYSGKILTLYLEKNDHYTAEIVEHPRAVALIPVINDKILFVEQYRHAAKKRLLELPAGLIENKEQPEEAAERELQEETGYFANDLQSLGGFYTSPGFCTEYIYLYLAKDLKERPLPKDDGEEISLVELTLSDAEKKIETGQIEDAKTILGIYRFKSLV